MCTSPFSRGRQGDYIFVRDFLSRPYYRWLSQAENYRNICGFLCARKNKTWQRIGSCLNAFRKRAGVLSESDKRSLSEISALHFLAEVDSIHLHHAAHLM